MKNKMISLVFMMVFFSIISSYSQTQNYCGTTSPNQSELLNLNSQFQQWLSEGGVTNPESTPVIPIAFHIIMDNQGNGDVTNSKITQQLAVLNSEQVGALGYAFSLYSIDRTYNSAWFSHSIYSQEEIEMKNALSINPLQILNIYIWGGDGTYIGYARFPWEFDEDSKMHGVTIKYTTLPDGNEPLASDGKTAAHEVGHFLGLLHTYQNDCDWPGDNVDDTPYHTDLETVPDCLLNADTCPKDEGFDPNNNYMNKVRDACKTEFTTGQKNYALFNMVTHRPVMHYGISQDYRNVSVYQRFYNSEVNVDSIGIWDDGLMKFSKTHVPNTFSWRIDSYKTLLGTQKIFTNQKHKNWEVNNQGENNVVNHKKFQIQSFINNFTSRLYPTQNNVTIKNSIEGPSVTIGTLHFKDPWLIDYADPDYGNTKRNRGMKNEGLDKLEFKEQSSPFNPDYSTNYNGDIYQGVFLEQSGPPLWNPPYYSVKAENEFSADLTQTQKTHTFYFKGWSETPTGSANFQYSSQLQTPVVFLSENAVVSANYKGTQLSEDTKAFWNNNQRKFIRTPDGYLHQVYESNGDIYYEIKHEEDENWVFMNNGNRIGIGKNPAIDYCSYSYVPESMGEIVSCEVFIVFAEPSGTDQNIRLQRYRYDPSEENFYTLQQSLTVPSGNMSTSETTPLIAFHSNNKISVVWQKTFNSTTLRLSRGTFSTENGITINSTIDLGNSSNGVNYTLAASKEGETALHLAWEERSTGSPSYGTIYYSEIPDPDATSITLTRNNISQNSGCYDNSYPSMIERGGGVRVVWRGLLNDEEESEEIGMGESQTSVVVFTDPGNYYYYWLFGNNVEKPVINQATTDPYYTFVWAEEDGATNKFADNTLSTIRTASTTGKYLQLSGGKYKSDIYLNAHTENEGVKYFAQSENFTKLYKENNVPISKGRQGVVGIDSVQFYFVFGDIEVNGGKVDFEELSYTADISQNQVFNSYLRSEPFALNDNSEFSYSVIYGVSDSLGAVNVLSPNNKVSFKTELIDEETNEVIGTFDATEYGSGNVINYRNIAYEVNTEGIGNRTVRLRLVITPTSECNYTLGNRIAEWSAMGKSGKTKISYRGTDIPTEYALFQNYPNPFNPVTTITYQIPKEGLVTLKIYDILGKEVTTLLNEEKQAGKYSIEFNASRLSSGVYLYELRSNEYKSTKKLLLMK